MLKALEAKESMGMRIGISNGANFTIFDIGVHYHPAPQVNATLEEDDLCNFRWGFYFTLFNFRFSFGKFWEFSEYKKK